MVDAIWWTRCTSVVLLKPALPFMKKKRLRCMCVKEHHWFEARRALGYPLTEVRRLDTVLEGEALKQTIHKLEAKKDK